MGGVVVIENVIVQPGREAEAELHISVTDAMPSVGTNTRSFRLHGRKITVSGPVCRDEDGRLAGSKIDMASCVRNSIALLGLTLSEAVCMASLYPAQFLGLAHELGRIEPTLCSQTTASMCLRRGSTGSRPGTGDDRPLPAWTRHYGRSPSRLHRRWWNSPPLCRRGALNGLL